jgi:hypothetical protein
MGPYERRTLRDNMPSYEHAIVDYTSTVRSAVFHKVFHQKNLTKFIIKNQIDTRSVQITPAPKDVHERLFCA